MNHKIMPKLYRPEEIIIRNTYEQLKTHTNHQPKAMLCLFLNSSGNDVTALTVLGIHRCSSDFSYFQRLWEMIREKTRSECTFLWVRKYPGVQKKKQ